MKETISDNMGINKIAYEWICKNCGCDNVYQSPFAETTIPKEVRCTECETEYDVNIDAILDIVIQQIQGS